MTMTTTPLQRELQQEEILRLPERLGADGVLLALLDGAAALAVLIFGAIVGDVRAAMLALTPLVSFAWWMGRYRFSFAGVPADELYATFALAAPAAAVVALAVPVLQTSPGATSAAFFSWTALASASAVIQCARRRGAHPRWIGVCPRVDHIGRARSRSMMLRALLEISDVVIALGALIVLSPVFVVCALAILRDSGPPVLFKQRRIGYNDREFVMYKFRTMHENAGTKWAALDDDRVTNVGRFLRRTSLDELPQLWNVVKGEMSLVGPRPEMCEYADRFAGETADYSDRHLVPPGITGWAQINYERNFAPENAREVLYYDLFYVRYRSFSLYTYCIMKTLCEVFTHRAL
jgi:lipopolysaccharide/colanic/teichoic acid biosynthesis glycosyltransferase